MNNVLEMFPGQDFGVAPKKLTDDEVAMFREIDNDPLVPNLLDSRQQEEKLPPTQYGCYACGGGSNSPDQCPCGAGGPLTPIAG